MYLHLAKPLSSINTNKKLGKNWEEKLGTQYPFPNFYHEMITRLVRLDNQEKGNSDVKKIGKYVLCPQLLVANLTSLELSFILFQDNRLDFRGNRADTNWYRQKANSYCVFEVAALNGLKYNIEADKLFWISCMDTKET